ncbi:MAG: AAA family ATPase [Candidatus Hermodarchaeota archaeon]
MTINCELDEKFRNRIQTIMQNLNHGLYERTNIVNLSFLSVISGESIFMLGPPGVAKSLIARRLKFAFKDATSFEYLMHRFSTPDEVFGPISISKLKNDDKLERMVENYLPGANIAFLDEIWKAGPSIQNTLLTIINEKIFRNGGQELPVDLLGLIAASNELPEEGQGLEALWDRFLIRTLVTNIENRKNFEQMIVNTSNLYSDDILDTIKITIEEYKHWQELRNEVDVPEEILELIHHIRTKIEKFNQDQLEKENNERKKSFYISDRRWKKIIKILRTSAFLNGRKFVDLMDCFLIPYMLWDEPDQILLVHILVKESIRHKGYTLLLNLAPISKELDKLSEEITTETSALKIKKIKKLKEYKSKYYKIKDFNHNYFIKIEDYNNLSSKNSKHISFYNSDQDHAYSYDYYCRKVGGFKILIDDELHELERKDFEEKEIFTKKPHELLIKNWDAQIKNLKNLIEQDLEKINHYKEIDLKFLNQNLFIESIKSKIIFQRIEELETQLHQLDLKCNEQQNKYHSIKQNETTIVQSKSKTRRSKRG